MLKNQAKIEKVSRDFLANAGYQSVTNRPRFLGSAEIIGSSGDGERWGIKRQSMRGNLWVLEPHQEQCRGHYVSSHHHCQITAEGGEGGTNQPSSPPPL